MPVTIFINLDTGSIVFSAPQNVTPTIEFNLPLETLTVDSIIRLLNMKNVGGFGGWAQINLS
jgi:hypothetical protein